MPTPRPYYGISRIDQPEKKNHGFYVRITHRGKTQQKYFPDKSNGGKNKALKAAQAYRDAIVAKLPKAKQEAASQKRRKVKQSGVTGVTHVLSKIPGTSTTYEYWQAAWNDEAGRRRTAKFSISRYGDDKALQMAIKARRAAARRMKAAAAPATPAPKPAAKKATAKKVAAKKAAGKTAAKKKTPAKKKAAKRKK